MKDVIQRLNDFVPVLFAALRSQGIEPRVINADCGTHNHYLKACEMAKDCKDVLVTVSVYEGELIRYPYLDVEWNIMANNPKIGITGQPENIKKALAMLDGEGYELAMLPKDGDGPAAIYTHKGDAMHNLNGEEPCDEWSSGPNPNHWEECTSMDGTRLLCMGPTSFDVRREGDEVVLEFRNGTAAVIMHSHLSYEVFRIFAREVAKTCESLSENIGVLLPSGEDAADATRLT
jgi:hypothetical protein